MKPLTGDEFILLESIGNRMEKNQSSAFLMSRNTKNQSQDDSRTNNKSKLIFVIHIMPFFPNDQCMQCYKNVY